MPWTIITAVLEAASNFFKWRAIEAEIQSRLLVKTEIDRIEKENEDFQNKITVLRANSDTASNELADQLRHRANANAAFGAAISAKIPVSESKPTDPK